VDYYDRRSAALAIMTLHGRHIYGQAIKVNWAYASTQREDTSGHFHIFVGDLSSEVNDATLYACFSAYPSCSDARVMWDNKTGRSRGYGFVSFRNQQARTSQTSPLWILQSFYHFCCVDRTPQFIFYPLFCWPKWIFINSQPNWPKGHWATYIGLGDLAVKIP
jgi:hypothetical protein